ncbi:XRE family transcriptional regulator [Rhizobium sp. LjRoot30]|uniref:helix-turn-helix domain-containing protein n=1 Tax=Rhizobium sp. LjRoot30 TaxID=3342320 RepID=UPI00092BB31D|nr:MAG: XRE family transcriptional regulator [Rhizobium sp. 63-7]
MFNRKRLTLARQRRGLSGIQLAEKSGITAVTISRLESGQTRNPDEDTIASLAHALDYPAAFFTLAQDVEELDPDTVSFRSLKKMSSKEKDAALAAGSLGLDLYDWVETEYSLRSPDLLDLGRIGDPESAARLLRQHWGLGDRPIGNVLRLLESKGVRVLSLSERTHNVDAFSFWRKNLPFVFLNTFKTPEHTIFDCGHELGHLILHQHAGPRQSKSAEMEANRFAAAFLMPEHDIKAVVPRHGLSVGLIIKAKQRWRVSAMALTVRLNQLGWLSDWQYRTFCIELGRRGFRSSEPNGIERERSEIWQQILADLWKRRMTKKDIAQQLNLPHDEVESLIFGLAGMTTAPSIFEKPRLVSK